MDTCYARRRPVTYSTVSINIHFPGDLETSPPPPAYPRPPGPHHLIKAIYGPWVPYPVSMIDNLRILSRVNHTCAVPYISGLKKIIILHDPPIRGRMFIIQQ